MPRRTRRPHRTLAVPAVSRADRIAGVALARAGQALFAGTGVSSDMYVLALPLSQGHSGLGLFAFLGGMSAATGMVVVSTLTLSLMIGNHWLAPGLLRRSWKHPSLM